MNTSKRSVSFNGFTLTLGEWSRKLGIKHSTLANRLDNGWSVEMAFLTKPNPSFHRDPDKRMTKNDAEMLLNETSYENLPIMVAAYIGQCHGVRYGTFFRNEFRPEFNKWFETKYIPAHEKKST